MNIEFYFYKRKIIMKKVNHTLLTIVCLSLLITGVSTTLGAPTVSKSGNTITITGNGNQTASSISLGQGVYIFSWTGKDMMVIMVNSPECMVPASISLTEAKGSCLFAVDNTLIKSGDMSIDITVEGPWTITITKVESKGEMLPQVLSSSGIMRIVSKPFNAKMGTLSVTYTYNGSPNMAGNIVICEVTTGKHILTPHMFETKGSISIDIPAAGVYIAEAILPIGATGGTITINQ
jgi:hypothetical protein